MSRETYKKGVTDMRKTIWSSLIIIILLTGCNPSQNISKHAPFGITAHPLSMQDSGMQAETAAIPGERPERFNTETYDKIDENEFQDAVTNPLSTFSIDVDTASYSNARRFIDNSRLPPKDAVRIEEFINYFTYDYPQPTDNHPFAIVTEQSQCPWNPSHRLMHIGLQGKKIPLENLPPCNLVFLLDVSGSMNYPNKVKAYRLIGYENRILAKSATGEDKQGYRGEFVQLVKTAQLLGK